MTRRFVFVGAAMAAALSLNLAALASANDYVFEPVKAEIKKGNDVIVSVRLKHKATGKPITPSSFKPGSTWRRTAWPKWPRG